MNRGRREATDNMFRVATLVWPAIAGICLYAAFLHLQNGLRRPIDRVHTLFGLLAIGMAIVIYGSIELSGAHDAAQYQRAAWIFTFSWTAVFALLPWFITHYADEPNRIFAGIVSVSYFVVWLANFFQPYSILI